ncbi:hypothetical protein C8C76_11229 [Halanaerobium saccharolyticum]|uniref:Type IV pilus biogenesis protein PilP n=1 Tax=Halanaerobium saccharolyticum TaxID=43595 RepID=A0A2T5RJY1_9FIRM|nr:hypothetical protein [Halanaerobium saccharolyticum]PTV99094.1 hypothetical protein C8C76_11229 [Halanaerobium saccharolyticum]
MKYLKLLFFIVLIITLNSTAFALNLDVDNDLNSFAKENLLNENETQNLTNPFFLNDQLEEVPEEEVELDTSPKMAVNTIENREEVEEINAEPEITINGVISASNSRMALLISYQQEKHLLEIGDSLDGYEFTAYQNGEATFKKDGREIKVLY